MLTQQKAVVHFPDFQRTPEMPNPTRLSELPIAIHHLQLVAALPDPHTGRLRDFHLPASRIGHHPGPRPLPDGTSIDEPYRFLKGTQVPGTPLAETGIVIPMPPRGNSSAGEPEAETQHDDTPLDDYFERSWTPELLNPPMPLEVLDELRGKYSKFRTRHEPWFVERTEERAQKWAQAQKMVVRGKKVGVENNLMTPGQMGAVKAVNRRRTEPGWKGGEGERRRVLEEVGRVMAASGVFGGKEKGAVVEGK